MNALLVSVPRGDNDEKNSHSVLSSSIDNLLDSARNALFALHSLVTALGNENYTNDAVEGMLLLNNTLYCAVDLVYYPSFVFIADFNQDLSKSISALKDAVALVRETGEEPELWSNKDVQSLLLYLQSSE